VPVVRYRLKEGVPRGRREGVPWASAAENGRPSSWRGCWSPSTTRRATRAAGALHAHNEPRSERPAP